MKWVVFIVAFVAVLTVLFESGALADVLRCTPGKVTIEGTELPNTTFGAPGIKSSSGTASATRSPAAEAGICSTAGPEWMGFWAPATITCAFGTMSAATSYSAGPGMTWYA